MAHTVGSISFDVVFNMLSVVPTASTFLCFLFVLLVFDLLLILAMLGHCSTKESIC